MISIVNKIIAINFWRDSRLSLRLLGPCWKLSTGQSWKGNINLILFCLQVWYGNLDICLPWSSVSRMPYLWWGDGEWIAFSCQLNYWLDISDYRTVACIVLVCVNQLTHFASALFQDYKTYLDFVLALENRREPQALQYLFRLLDVQNKGFLNIFDLNFFFRVRMILTFRDKHFILLGIK